MTHAMMIRRLSLISGARRAEGLAVIIDVLRAFTTAAYVMNNGADAIIPVGSLEEAFGLKRLNPEWVLMGERGGRPPKGFDYGNSPYEVRDLDFTGKMVIQTTAAGTQGIVNAREAEEIILGSFVMAGAIIKYIQRRQPEILSVVAMGNQGIEPCAEDELCARYIEEALAGKLPDFEEFKRKIKSSRSVNKFFDPSQPQYRLEDLQLALDLDRFSFILRIEKKNRLPIAKKQY